MATQIFGRDHAAWLGRRDKARKEAQAGRETPDASGSAFRGLFYAVLFNVIVAAAIVGMWEFWRHVR